jgi:hypothetical protein
MRQVHTTSTEREHVLDGDCWCAPEVQQVRGKAPAREKQPQLPPAVTKTIPPEARR